MRGPNPPSIELTEDQKEILEQLARGRTQSHGPVTRAKLVLLAAAGKNNQEIAQQLQVQRGMVRSWRGRWLAAAERLAQSRGAVLREQVESVLADAPRSGAPATFTAEQLCRLAALACEEPEASGRAVTHWTSPELAAKSMREMVKRGIVQQISPRSVGRFLKRGRYPAASVTLLVE